MKLKDIIKGIECELHGSADIEIKSIEFDSRRVSEDCLFVAQRGTKVDGHSFIGQAISQGAVAVVCEALPADLNPNQTYLKVDDSSQALGFMASNFYGNPSARLRLVGITGTNGKTTTVTLLHRMFRMAGHHVGLLSTIVNRIDEEEIASTHTTP
ncbi:MAG: UDP-N-acetylmuramoyl-L-alanyl-D-glutamate--2,6-diaminopimelate ligase, partial [Bacteroidales bacterium]|nr:UDP-N-acetylmuramoyl-L-alanyl-D-glutamate--2,6-diaminopimelate ligase [Bacteroidales bacterium]